MNTDYLCERTLAEKQPFYSRLVKNMVVVLYRALENYKLYFPDFTDHTILHSMQVMDFCNRLIGENIYSLNEDELYILIMAVYLHDSGMGISQNEYKALYDTVVSAEFRASHPFSDTYETIRAFHHSFSRRLVMRYAELFEIPSPEHAAAIAMVCEAHRKVNLFDETECPSFVTVPGGNKVRIPYLGALIRLADELDIAADRNLICERDETDTVFKRMHRCITHLTVEPDRFVLDVNADDPALFDDIRREIGKLGDTLAECRRAALERSGLEISQKEVVINRISSGIRPLTVLDAGDGEVPSSLLMKAGFTPDCVITDNGKAAFEETLKHLENAPAVTYIALGSLSRLREILESRAALSKITGVYVLCGALGGAPRPGHSAEDVNALLSSGLNITLFPAPETTAEARLLPLLYLRSPESFTLEDVRVRANDDGGIYPSGSGCALHVMKEFDEGLLG